MELLQYTASKNLTVAGFEVGNEKEHALSPSDYASCMLKMRKAIDKLWPDPLKRPLLIGPDENPRADWLHEMLNAGGNVADVITYHLYAGYGLDPSLSKELVDPGFLDFTRVIAGDVVDVVRSAAPNAQLWVGETAAAWHSGEANITDAFESGFWYIDQLGTVASMNHEAMCRQAFVGGNYSMLGVNDGFIPKPDYWSGLLFKRLMGNIVITSHQSEPASSPYRPQMRGYIHCSNRRHTDEVVPPGAITFAFVNVDATQSFEINLHGINTDGSSIDTSTREEFVLSSDKLSSKKIYLNGKLLSLDEAGNLPPLFGARIEGGRFVAPPRTYGFVRFPLAGAHTHACRCFIVV